MAITNAQNGLLERAGALDFYNLLSDKAKSEFNAKVKDMAGLLTDGSIQDKHLIEAMQMIKQDMIAKL